METPNQFERDVSSSGKVTGWAAGLVLVYCITMRVPIFSALVIWAISAAVIFVLVFGLIRLVRGLAQK